MGRISLAKIMVILAREYASHRCAGSKVMFNLIFLAFTSGWYARERTRRVR